MLLFPTSETEKDALILTSVLTKGTMCQDSDWRYVIDMFSRQTEENLCVLLEVYALEVNSNVSLPVTHNRKLEPEQ